MSDRILMDEVSIARMLTRLAHELVEHNKGTEELCVIGIRRRGEYVAHRIVALVKKLYGVDIPHAGIDIGMYRDDLVSGFFVPNARMNEFGFSVDGKRVVLCDDVLHTGRSVRAAIEAIFDLGRPACIELLVICDRGGHEMPISPDFVGKNIPTARHEWLNLSLREIEGMDSLGIRSENE